MKRLKSNDDLELYGDKGVVKDWGRRKEDPGLHRSSPSLHRSSYYKSSDNGRKVLSPSSSRYDRLEDDRESSRLVRKRSEYDVESYDRKKSYDRPRDVKERGIMSSSPRPSYGMDKIHRSESFSGPRRDFPKGFRSERDRPRRDGNVTSWRKFGSGKDGDDGARSGSEASRGNRMGSEEVAKSTSPKSFRDAKSPVWSKDSGSEQSKSIEVKKYEDMSVESGGPSSEREEGELEPDPHISAPLTEPVKDKDIVETNLSRKELNNETHVDEKVWQDIQSCPESRDVIKIGSCEDDTDVRLSKIDQNALNENKDLPDCQEGNKVQETGECGDENEKMGETEAGSDVMKGRRGGNSEGDSDRTFNDNLSPLQKQSEAKPIDLKMKGDKIDTTEDEDKREISLTDEMTRSWKDKGKSVAVLPTTRVYFEETNLEVENKPRDLSINGDAEMGGPSIMGFQFFSSDPIKKQESVAQSSDIKPKDEKLALELSLSLPNVLLPIGSVNRNQAPGSPSYAGSIQSFPSSFQTNSDRYTASVSYSGSQQFTHNPSCSLTHNGYDFEKSVGSKPLFQGVDWNALSAEENNKSKEIPSFQRVASIENGFHQHSQVSERNSNGQAARVPGGSSKEPIAFEKELSFNKHLSRNQLGVSHENIVGGFNDRRQIITWKDSGDSKRNQNPIFGLEVSESMITMIVSEPLHTIARVFNDITAQQMAFVKEFVLDIITNPDKQWQLNALQRAMHKRSDTLDMLVNTNRALVEILLALKTGLQQFLIQKHEIPSSDLAEIFINTRCKNLACRSSLPVDECDCKICARQNGFCRECMCLVCSKFDNASNTCSWVGCDVCLHWCHADCALCENYIRNGQSVSGVQGDTEMQFHCVACDHPSEMFGFVKEVFQNFVKEWKVENLSREFEYVRKIFNASEDVRGKQLHEIAIRMLSKLGNKADLLEVQNHIMSFFTEIDSVKPGNIPNEPRTKFPTKNQERSNGNAGYSQGAGWIKSDYYPEKATPSKNYIDTLPPKTAYPDKSTTPSENPINMIPGFDKHAMNIDFQSNSEKEPVFDELERIVRIKHAEAKMFQTRADDARREAEALKTISVTKNEKIEEEYESRIRKLCLTEAEEMRRQKVEELQEVERAYHEYFSMKMRMESEIKDLLLKMEATRRNFNT